LQAIGVKTGRRGVQVSKYLRSESNPNVFSVGDCADTGVPNLTPVSAYDARTAAKNILAGNDVSSISYPEIPSVVFTLPPVARIGLLESEAKEKGLKFDIKFQETANWYSSMRVGEKYSGFKILIEHDTKKILGAHILGQGAEEQINVFTMAITQGMTTKQLKKVIFAYPSYASDIAYML
jgi:glutathione reductase (NADPH)